MMNTNKIISLILVLLVFGLGFLCAQWDISKGIENDFSEEALHAEDSPLREEGGEEYFGLTHPTTSRPTNDKKETRRETPSDSVALYETNATEGFMPIVEYVRIDIEPAAQMVDHESEKTSENHSLEIFDGEHEAQEFSPVVTPIEAIVARPMGGETILPDLSGLSKFSEGFEEETKEAQTDFAVENYVAPREKSDAPDSFVEQNAHEPQGIFKNSGAYPVEQTSHLAQSQSAPPRRLPQASATTSAKFLVKAHKTEIREILRKIVSQSNLHIYASIDVQGDFSCDIESADVDEVFRRLLSGSDYDFKREQNFVWIAPRSRIHRHTRSILARSEQDFAMRHVSAQDFERVVRPCLSVWGSTQILATRRETLRVQDLDVVLDDLVEIQKLVDVPKPELRLDVFVFQHETDGFKKGLDLKMVAENRGLMIQEIATDGEKPSENDSWRFPLGGKKKKTSEYQAYAISHRLDTFLIGIEDQRNVRLASQRDGAGMKPILDAPMEFPFALQLDENQEPYVLTLVVSENAAQDAETSDENAANGRFRLALVCRPANATEASRKMVPIEFSTTLDLNHGLIVQSPMAEFSRKNTEKRKNPVHVLTANKVGVEAVLVAVIREEAPLRPETYLTSLAIRALAKQQEVEGYELMKTRSAENCATAARCYEIAQQLKTWVYDVKIR
ncbi:MAG: hypothetical protein Q4D38_00605 [Planctomycetia bacterium]|nr:hypothetical protein [Planctomycetia bacterium]